ncbi:MAG: hypothetical protein C4290_13965 [Chloroflexota bacterium]
MDRITAIIGRVFLGLITALGTWLPVNALAVSWLGEGPTATLLGLVAAAAGAWAGATVTPEPLAPLPAL